MLNAKSVCVLKTFPADSTGGIPPDPITESAGLQLISRSISDIFPFCGFKPSTTGSPFQSSSPTTAAISSAELNIFSSISVCREGKSIRPVAESSILSSRCLAILKEEGTAPPAIPE